jgi:hypothetical protein
MTTTYVQMVGRIAYVWGWPLVNMANRIAAIAKVPEPGLLGGALPVAYNRLAMLTGYIAPDERFVTCPNQDVVYATGWFNLDNGRLSFRCPISVIAFGSTLFMTPAPTNSRKLANNTAPNPASI